MSRRWPWGLDSLPAPPVVPAEPEPAPRDVLPLLDELPEAFRHSIAEGLPDTAQGTVEELVRCLDAAYKHSSRVAEAAIVADPAALRIAVGLYRDGLLWLAARTLHAINDLDLHGGS